MKGRNHWHWRWHTNYGGGQLMDWIGHHNDICHWGLGMDNSGPSKIEAVGWTWPTTEIYDSPVDYEVRCEYAGGIQTSIGSINPMGCKWIGENGWIHVTRGKITASNEAWLKDFDRSKAKAYHSPNHQQNFADGIARERSASVRPRRLIARSLPATSATCPRNLVEPSSGTRRRSSAWVTTRRRSCSPRCPTAKAIRWAERSRAAGLSVRAQKNAGSSMVLNCNYHKNQILLERLSSFTELSTHSNLSYAATDDSIT